MARFRSVLMGIHGDLRRWPGRPHGFLACALAALLLSCIGAQAEPAKIRIGFAVVPANLFPLLDAVPGASRHRGQSYTIELTRFAGTPQQMAGFAADEIDMGSFSFSTIAIAVENAGVEDARIIADILQDGAHGANSNELMVLKDGPIRTVEDLPGKSFATIGAGGSSDMAMRLMLRRHGLDDKTALTYVEVGFPNMKAMLLSRKVDIITAVTPFSQDPELRAAARTLFTQADVLGPTSLLMLVTRAGFIAKNREAVIDLLEDELRAVRWLTDPANHRQAVEIVTRFTKQPASLYEGWVFTKTGDQYRDPDGMPDIAGAQKSIDLQHQFGTIKSSIEVAKYVDLSLVKEAAARLGHDR
jgi:NitT/TauT family transport system substrate-binding protein